MKKKHLIIYLVIGLISIFIFFITTSGYEKTFSRSIVIRKTPLKVFYEFFSQKHLLSLFENTRSVTAPETPTIGSKVVFHLESHDISFEIIDFLEPELVKWKNFNSIHEFKFKKNAIGTVVHFDIVMRGTIAYLFQIFNRSDVEKRLAESLLVLKACAEDKL